MIRKITRILFFLLVCAVAFAFVPLSERAQKTLTTVSVPFVETSSPELLSFNSFSVPSIHYASVNIHVLKNLNLSHVRLIPAFKLQDIDFVSKIGFNLRLQDVPSITHSYSESLLDSMMMEGFRDGSLTPRSPIWRNRLMSLMVNNPTGPQYDELFKLILRGFPGADDFSRAEGLRKWALSIPSEQAGEIWRAEARFWLQASESSLAIAAAERMARVRPDFRARACRLKTLAYASYGDFTRARECIAEGRRHGLPDFERLELLYLEAWMDLQDGQNSKAIVILKQIVAEDPKCSTAEKARSVLSSLNERSN